MNEKASKRIAFLLFFVAALTARPVLPLARAKKNPNPPTRKVVVCPDSVSYELQTPPDWSPGLSSRISLKFESSSTDGKSIYCEYDVNNAQYKNHATLTQAVPRGMRCTNDGAKSKRFTCEPNAPLIRTGRQTAFGKSR